MCGIVGLVLGNKSDNAAVELLEGLVQLQHRGQDSCGVATSVQSDTSYCFKGQGLISEVFVPSLQPGMLAGSLGIGHVRYRTAGTFKDTGAQPIRCNRGKHELYLAHNGHVSSSRGAKHQAQVLYSDSHYTLSVLSTAMEDLSFPWAAIDLKSRAILALQAVYDQCDGSFACVAMVDSALVLGFRDPYGIKPLILGSRCNHNGKTDYMLASESVALDKLGFQAERDIGPGEAVLIDGSAISPKPVFHQIVPARAYSPDVFEYVYFARPESVIDGISVQKCRQQMGVALAETVLDKLGLDVLDEVDAIIPVPESGYVSALALSQHLNIPFAMGLVKNSYCHRSFILPGHEKRLQAVWRKLSAVRHEFDGKCVLVVDDSIVRGGTSREIVCMARKAGAQRVIFASSSPAIRFNHIYGIDLADPKALVAHGRTEEEVADVIGADAVIFLPLDKLIESCFAVRAQSSGVDEFEVGVFSGVYVTSALTASKVGQVGTLGTVNL